MREQRLARVCITSTFLFSLLTQDNEISATKTVNGLPKDAIFIYIYLDDAAMQFFLVFYHESFGVVKPGEQIPELKVNFERVNNQNA